MVISQIAGLATAFGTGELSGAGFGPNYTILMKLGYEFFAPRILEEMEKNPNVFFQDTLWFQKFQKQIKLYSDKVMEQTLDTLLHIPQDTIDAITTKFENQGIFATQEQIETGTGLPRNPPPASLTQTGDPWEGWNNFWNAMSNRIPNIPQAFGSDTPPISTSTGQGPTQGSLISLNFLEISRFRFEDLNNAMSAITRNNSPYDSQTQQRIRTAWEKARVKQAVTTNKQRQQQITTFQNVTIPKSNIPPRSTKRPAGQSVKIERNKLIVDIARKARQLLLFQRRPKTSQKYQFLIDQAIRQLKLLQQKLTFLLNNYTFK